MKPRVWGAFLALVGVGLGATLARQSAVESARSEDGAVALRSGSRLLRSGGLTAGQPLAPGQARSDVARRVSSALASIPPELRPASVLVDIEPSFEPGVPPIDVLEYHRASRSLLVGASGQNAVVELWLHELGHARMSGSRPRGVLARRVIDAVEEGFADYFAASIARSPRLGTPPRQRDLQRPPRVGASEWASLAVDGFDAHRMGWVLAARLYELDPLGGSLLRDAVACLDGESELGAAADSPAAALDALLAACPEQGRARLSRVLHDWLPPQLYSAEVPT